MELVSRDNCNIQSSAGSDARRFERPYYKDKSSATITLLPGKLVEVAKERALVYSQWQCIPHMKLQQAPNLSATHERSNVSAHSNKPQSVIATNKHQS